MALNPGTKLGPYEIVSALGAGGMGEVYRALDTRLERTVAIKVLSPQVISSTNLKERFEREAKAISALNHPNICHLYDVGSQDGTEYLVMQYLEGDTLADRLERGPIPPQELLRVGSQVSDALDKAHQQGIIHRDLKPGNIMLTQSGAKVLDFGLAKQIQPASASAAAMTAMTSSKPLTAEGTVVGTFQYMSPEQIEGQEADPRSDIFALGCVLYEMATAKRPFAGKTQASVIASILASEPPPLSSVAPLTPPALERLVRSCMAKEKTERVQSAHDVKLQLDWIAEAGSQAGLPAPLVARRRLSQRAAWVVAAIAALLAIAFAIGFVMRAPQPGIAMRAALVPPKEQQYDPFSFALSPDGKKLAFVATDSKSGRGKLYVRPLNSTSTQELAGTEDAQYPFWSPDSSSIAFYSQSKLKKIEAGGGPVLALADVADGRGGAWSSEGVIIFSRNFTGEGLSQVSEAGGPVSELTHYSKEKKEDSHRFPSFLPDGRHFIFYISSSLTPSGMKEGDPVAGLYLGDLKTKKVTYLLQTESNAQYANGYLFYLQQHNLMAHPFDVSSARFSGAPVPVAQQVQYNADRWLGSFSVSTRGTLVYMGGNEATRQLQWFSRDGKPLETVGPPGMLGHPALSPDGKKLAFSQILAATPNRDIWIYDLGRGSASRLTFNEAADNLPLWTRDGTRVAYTNERTSFGDIYIQSSSGLGGEELVPPSTHDSYKTANDWTPDGKSLVYMNLISYPSLWVHDFSPGKSDYQLLKTSFAEAEAKFSPDGHWLSYTSEETGRSEVYVVPYPGLNGKWQVSTNGGAQARWRKDGKELIFVSPEGKLMSAAVSAAAGTFKAETPKPLFESRIVTTTRDVWQYDMTPDAQKFIINSRMEHSQEPITLYANWPAEVRK
jgi:eukaryotic-like serine/threonine-protein kinase